MCSIINLSKYHKFLTVALAPTPAAAAAAAAGL
jgi:hypothetical protein